MRHWLWVASLFLRAENMLQADSLAEVGLAEDCWRYYFEALSTSE